MAKTRRKKINKSPGRAFRNSRTFVAEKGDMVKCAGTRGRTEVKRVTDDAGKRLTTVRVVADVPQVQAKGDNVKPIFVGRVYTGRPRSKTYPYGSVRRGFTAPIKPIGLMGGLAKAIKRVVVGQAAE